MPDNPPPELSTTRVSGGGSARLIALAVAGVLVAVVGFTVINRPRTPVAPSPPAPAVAAVATPTPAPSPSPESGSGDFTIHFDNRPPVSYQFVATAEIVGGQVPILLKQDAHGAYRGSVVLEAAQTGPSLMVGLRRQWRALGVQVSAVFAAANVDLDKLLQSHGRKVTLLIDVVEPDPAPGIDSPLSSGFTLTIRGKRSGSQLTIFFKLEWAADVVTTTR